tara:strand:- start:126 stop:881 length:756 start_codon:yes stop_codon:yes gene_type:complete
MANKRNASVKKAAKAKKRASKGKPDAKLRQVRHVHAAVTDVYNRLYFTGSSTTVGVCCHNLKKLGALLKGKDFRIGETIIKDKLRTEDVVWYLWIGVFSDDGDEIWCDPVMVESEPCTVKDFDEFINPLIQKHVEEIDAAQLEELGVSHTKGYGWVATPTETCHLEASEGNFVPWFINRDVLNEEKRKDIYVEGKGVSLSDTMFDGNEEILIEAERQYNNLKRTTGIGKRIEPKKLDKTTAELKALMSEVA